MRRVSALQTILADREIVNRELERVLRRQRGVPSPLRAAMGYAVLSNGKRLRPVFALEAFRACGGEKEEWILPFCCGIEFIHTFSLIHDDLPSMDNDDFRRGQPTVHRKFDEATAILAGDALLALAYELFVRGPAPIERRVEATLLISQAIGPRGMAGGQMLDIKYGGKADNRGAPSVAIARLKTGELFAAALTTGAIIAGAEPALKRKLHRLGLDLGILFQLTDDLLDRPGREPKADSRRLRAELLAKKTKKGFSELGGGFSFFTKVVPLILKRKG